MRERTFYRIAKEINPGNILHCANIRKQRFSQARGRKWAKYPQVLKQLLVLQNAGHKNLYIDIIPESKYRGYQSYTYKKWHEKKTIKTEKPSDKKKSVQIELTPEQEEIQRIKMTLKFNTTKKAAAEELGIHPDTLRKRCKKYSINV